MNVLFVSTYDETLLPNGLLKYPSDMHLGISYIAALLNRHGHRTELFVSGRMLRKRYAQLDDLIDAFQPKLICFTAVFPEYEIVKDLARHVKKSHPDIYLAIGGVHVTINPTEPIADVFDAVCVGEGEDSTLELVSQLDKGQTPSRIPNFWIKQGSTVEKNPPRTLTRNIDFLPFPERRFWGKWMSQKEPKNCFVLANRGCPSQCTYCSNHALRKIAPGPYVRHRSPENIIAEIKAILAEFPTISEICISCETLVINMAWCVQLTAALERFNSTLPQPLAFETNIHIVPQRDYNPVFEAFKKANFQMINIGVESGNDRIRREVLKRNYTNDDVIHVVELARKYGLKVCFYILVGTPTETPEQFMDTVRLTARCRPDRTFVSIFNPYPGTDLYKTCQEMGLLTRPLDSKNERKVAVLDFPGFPKKEIQKCADYFDYYVHSGYSPQTIWKVHWPRSIYRSLSRIPYMQGLLDTVKDSVKTFLKPTP